MEFIRKDNQVIISSEKKEIILGSENITLDTLFIDTPGEYEKGGFLMYVREDEAIRYYHFRVEGYWIGYISGIPTEIPAQILDFLGQLDILVAPFGKTEQKFLEQIEPKMLVSFSDSAADLVQLLGTEVSSGTNYKLKAQDISTEKTSLVILL